MKLDGGPWFVGLDELLRHYAHGANGLPCALAEPCTGETLPSELLASGPDTILHIATRNNDINAVRNVSQTSLTISFNPSPNNLFSGF